MRQIYLSLKEHVEMNKLRPILLQDIANVYADPKIASEVLRFPVDKGESKEVVIDVINVVKMLKEEFNNVEIFFTQNDKTLVLFKIDTNLKKNQIKNKMMVAVELVFSILVIFFGTGVAIMTFHNDVSMSSTQKRIYELVMGVGTDKTYLISIPYSIGVFLGVIYFFKEFNRSTSSKLTPIDVEMDKYIKDLDTSHIKNIEGKA